MRATLGYSAVIAIGVVLSGPIAGRAADTPNAAQLIESLTPEKTRGITFGGQTASPPSTGTAKSAQASLSVPFATRSAEISPAAARVLDQLGEALASPKLADFKFRVEGHTDTVGRPEANRALSERRAGSVTAYLITKYHIDRTRLTPVGMGQDGLLVETGPGVANPANRRVVVVNLGR